MERAMLQARLDDLAKRYDVPGAVLGVLADGNTTVVATGVLNRATGFPVTPTSVFQIGSITKTYTATLVQRLVERNLLDLDVPAVNYLPELRVADPDVTRSVTLRHLLSHTSGIDGDNIPDCGRGDDALEKAVASFADLGQNHPLGASMSYCNAAFVIAGRVLEKVTGGTWDQVLREELVAPLGLASTVTLPEEAILHPAAVGHVGPGGSLTPTTTWAIPRTSGPAGLITASAGDVLTFARLFLDKGVAHDGTRVLSAESVDAMLEEQVLVPNPYVLARAVGLGWIRYDWDGRVVFGHDGSTIGQQAYLRAVPDRAVAVVLLTNGGGADDLAYALHTEVLGDLAGVTPPAKIAPVAGASGGDRSVQVGRYRNTSWTIDVTEHGSSGLRLNILNTMEFAKLLPENPPMVVDVLPVEDGAYAGPFPGSEGHLAFVFYTLDGGQPMIHFGARALPKVDADTP